MYYDQRKYDVRCEWSDKGIEAIVDRKTIVIIVDVLSFSTCVDIANSRGATIYPYGSPDEDILDFAKNNGAQIAGKLRSRTKPSLSPTSMQTLNFGDKLVLPSPNGSRLSLATGDNITFAGCLRNAHAVAHEANNFGTSVAVIPCGERWLDGTIRFALEDWLGAGAIIACLTGSQSPEAVNAYHGFDAAEGDLVQMVGECSSGRELIKRGCEEDVALASMLDVSTTVPVLRDGRYVNYRNRR
jgi:2-phosphosulfolactate phosphatase